MCFGLVTVALHPFFGCLGYSGVLVVAMMPCSTRFTWSMDMRLLWNASLLGQSAAPVTGVVRQEGHTEERRRHFWNTAREAREGGCDKMDPLQLLLLTTPATCANKLQPARNSATTLVCSPRLHVKLTRTTRSTLLFFERLWRCSSTMTFPRVLSTRFGSVFLRSAFFPRGSQWSRVSRKLPT